MTCDNVVWNMDTAMLNLTDLESGVIFDKCRMNAILAEQKTEQLEFQKKYGDVWKTYWLDDALHRHDADYDVFMKIVNTAIYYGERVRISGINRIAEKQRLRAEERMREVYGSEYEELKQHDSGDVRVVSLLLQDALRTKRWKELPDCLHDSYHRLVGDLC